MIDAGHEEDKRIELFKDMFGKIDEAHPPWIESPFTCDYVRILLSFPSQRLPASVHITTWTHEFPALL